VRACITCIWSHNGLYMSYVASDTWAHTGIVRLTHYELARGPWAYGVQNNTEASRNSFIMKHSFIRSIRRCMLHLFCRYISRIRNTAVASSKEARVRPMLVLRGTRCLVGSLKCISDEVIHQILSMCSAKGGAHHGPTVSLRWQASAAVLPVVLGDVYIVQHVDT
jgi:hypothetical protein